MKVLVIGDSCIDRYTYGVCERISPEAPVPILNFINVEEKLGMAANVEKNLSSLGMQTTLLTNHEKIIKERFVEKRNMQQLLRVDYESLPLKKLDIELLKNIEMDSFDAIVISDYDKGFITNDIIDSIIIKNKNILPIFVDSKKKDLSRFINCIIKVNETEEKNVIKWPDNCKKIVTLGSIGAKYCEKIYKGKKVEVFDVCGAGDSFLAGLVLGFLSLNNLEKAIQLANKVAAVSVSHHGVYAVNKDEIRF
jgi:D-beta-D-heptose 7-phosphate kinase/D-beta-D-heptose 1-phosphate adenosyltransferase